MDVTTERPDRRCNLWLVSSESEGNFRLDEFSKTVTWLPDTLSPTVDIFHAETSVGRAILMHQCFGELEHELSP
jgi:hypothetical protein